MPNGIVEDVETLATYISELGGIWLTDNLLDHGTNDVPAGHVAAHVRAVGAMDGVEVRLTHPGNTVKVEISNGRGYVYGRYVRKMV